MKRLFALLLTICLILVGCGEVTPSMPISEVTTPSKEPIPVAEPEPELTEDADFRNVKWGMTISEVKARETEGEVLLENPGLLLIGNLLLTGLDASLGYRFNVEGQLFAANYLITESHSNNTAFIADYNNLKDRLIDKYGAPDIDEIIWLDDLWKDNPSEWGMAIVTGDLTYYCIWELSSLTILLALKGDNFDVDFKLMYQCTEISDDTGKTGTEGL